MQQVITKREKATRATSAVRALQEWRARIGRKLEAWNEVRAIRTWRDRRR